MNEKYISRLGLAKDEIQGKMYNEFHSKEETKDFAKKMKKVLETGISLSYENRSQRDGRYFFRTLSPVKEPDGRITSLTVISKDITDIKQAENALLKETNQRKILSKRLIDLLEKDRQQTAMELHDHIGQSLTSIKLNLEMTQDRLKSSEDELTSQINAATEKTIQTLKDIKTISRGLRPSMLDELGLISSLNQLLPEIQHEAKYDIKFFKRNVPKQLPPETTLALYRITQEALTNITKYAQAKKVFVNLIKKDNTLFLTIEDDGVGFDLDKAMKTLRKKGPLGLLIMRERAIQLGGEFTLDSQIGRGTELVVEIPL